MKQSILGVAALSVMLASCSGINKETGGTFLGGATGALIGSQIGGGTGRIVAVAAGTLLGAWAGGALGRNLDTQDQVAMRQATTQSIQSGQSTQWSSSHNQGVSGTVTPTASYQSHQGYCRDFQQTVRMNGRSQTVHGTACKGSDGKWRVVN